MAQLIRKYNAGDRIVISDWLRHHGTADLQESPEELARLATEQALLEAEALRAQMQAKLDDTEQQVRDMLTEAQEEAISIQAAAQAQGYEDGYKQGIVDGQNKVEAAMAEVVSRVQSMLASLGAQRELALNAVELEVASLSLAISEKIVGHVAHVHQPLIDHTVHRALAGLTVEGPFVVRAHPDDCTFLAGFWQSGSPHRPDLRDGWRLVPDASIAPGGCILICGPTTVDAQLKTQLANVAAGLQLALPSSLPNSETCPEDEESLEREPSLESDIDCKETQPSGDLAAQE